MDGRPIDDEESWQQSYHTCDTTLREASMHCTAACACVNHVERNHVVVCPSVSAIA